MKKYKYTAVNINKEKFSGTFVTNDEKDLANHLMRQNLFLVSATPYSGGTPSAFITLGTGKVSLSDLTTFCRQFSIMLNAGISIVGSLECLKEQNFSTYFKSLLEVIYDDIKAGVALSKAMEKHKSVFPDFFRSMIYVGEVSGKLDEVFSALADYYEKDAAQKRKIKSALSYPIMLAVMAVGIVILMMVFVIPTFRDAMSSLNVEITGYTKVVYDISDFMVNYWLIILAVIAVIGVGAFIFGKTEKGAYLYDKLKLKLPLVKKVELDLVTARFARSFALMLASGMDIAEALDSVSVVLTNRDVTARFIKAAEEVKHGSKIAVAFEKYKLFPPLMIQMIAIGERTASLDEIMNRTCSFFDEQADIAIESVTSTIQPIMLLIMGALIGSLFIAVYSPMLSIMTQIA